MPDDPSAGGGINVGDAILTFLGDTTDLERAWSEMEENSTASATRTVNEVLRLYDKLGIEGSAKLNDAAEQAAESFEKLKASGVASMSDLVQAEQEVIERQIALKESLGQSIPPEVLMRLESLKMQYVGLTGTVAEFEAQQVRSAAFLEANARATDQNSIALQRQQVAIAAEVAAYEREIAILNEASAAKVKAAAKSTAAGEEGALAGAGLGAVGSTAGTLALYAGIAAVAGSLAEGVKAALDFDRAFTEVTTVIQEQTPHSAEVIAMLKQQLLELPPALGNITDLTHGVYQALSAGVPAAEAVQVVAKSAVFARAALTDLETSVKLVTASMNAYGLTAKDVDSITSALMATIQVGVLRGPQLAESLGRVLPVAANLKVSLSDVLGAASALTAGGLSADEAMTALRQVLSAIEKPSAEAKKAMTELGGSFAQIRQEIAEKGLGAGLADLAGKIKDNTTLTTEMFGNIRALTGMLGLMGPQAQKYSEDVAGITDAYNKANLAQIEFNKINESQSGQLKTMGNTISNEFVKAWEMLTPSINEAGSALSDIFIKTGALKVTIVALVMGLLNLGIVLAGVATIVDSVKSGIMGLALAFEEARYYTHAYAGSAEEFKAHLDELHGKMKQADSDAHDRAHSIGQMIDVQKALMSGTQASTGVSKEFEAAQLKLAQAQDDLKQKTKALNDALSDQARKENDAKDAAEAHRKEMEKLAKAAAKTTKAMEEYAKSHGVPLYEELLKNVDAARKFAQSMKDTDQPIASQIAALLNLNKQLLELRKLTEDKRTVGQTLSDIGSGGVRPQNQKFTNDPDDPNSPDAKRAKADKAAQLSADRDFSGKDDPFAKMKEESDKDGPLISSPLVDAFNVVLEAEKKLGVEGPTTLAKNAVEAENLLHTLRELWLAGKIGPEDVIAAEAKVTEANKKLADSFKSNLQISIENALEAEKVLGHDGTQAMIQHRNDVEKAFKDLKDSGVENIRQLQAAELIALKADRDLKLALGQPIPAAMNDSILKLTKSLKALQNQVAANKKEDQSWWQFWNQAAPSLKQDFNQLEDMGTEAFKSLSQAFGSAVQAFESGQESLGAAVEKAVAQTLESLSGQAAAYALYYTGLGLAALASGDEDSAGDFFVAAATMAAVAVVAGAAGMAMSSGSKSGASGGSGGASGSSISHATQGPVNPVNTVNVQRFGGGGLVTGRTLAMIGDSKSDPSKNATEAVLPLDDPEAMGKLRSGLGGSGMTVNIQGIVSPDNLGKVMDQMSDMVNAGKTLKASHANRVVKKS